jgi:hypothetical protein
MATYAPEEDADRAFQAHDRRLISLKDSTKVRVPGLTGIGLEMNPAKDIREIDAGSAAQALRIDSAAVEDYVTRYNRAMLGHWFKEASR